MPPMSRLGRGRGRRPGRWTAPALIAVLWLGIVAVAVSRLRHADGVLLAVAGFVAVGFTFVVTGWVERVRWIDPLCELTAYLRAARKAGSPRVSADVPRALGPLAAEVAAMLSTAREAASAAATAIPEADPQAPASGTWMTRSGLFEAPPIGLASRHNLQLSGDYSTTDMVNRLDPVHWRWLESSPAEQEFLGSTLDELRGRSFLDIVHPEDRTLARETFLQALERGEALGLVLRIKTGRGLTRSIEVNAGARYGTNRRVMHLRCHVTDITEKVRAERALRIRTRELTRANEELRRINRELKDLEAELHEKNRRLARANEELSRKNQELDEFAHVVSHDLQEPLRTLIAFSDFLLKDYGDRLEGEGQEFVRHLVDASRRMRAMILGMLNLSRAGTVIGEFQAVDLGDLAAVVKTDLGELIRSKRAEVRIAGPLPTVWGDRVRLGQLLANLMTNGLKYNLSPEPRVEIAATTTTRGAGDAESDPGEDALIMVKDNGIGIDPQFHAAIFQLFRRLHTREEFEGTGAGLAISSKIVHAHGGRIWVESEPGRGATFFVQLRRPPTQPPGEPAATATPADPAAIPDLLADEQDRV
jgi:PAS domain S-box-containing protein